MPLRRRYGRCPCDAVSAAEDQQTAPQTYLRGGCGVRRVRGAAGRRALFNIASCLISVGIRTTSKRWRERGGGGCKLELELRDTALCLPAVFTLCLHALAGTTEYTRCCTQTTCRYEVVSERIPPAGPEKTLGSEDCGNYQVNPSHTPLPSKGREQRVDQPEVRGGTNRHQPAPTPGQCLDWIYNCSIPQSFAHISG